MSRKKWLIAIVGSTACGKTRCAAKTAGMLETEVISADSRQLYRQMSIGTARPTEREMMGVRHHLIACRNVEEEYSAGMFERDALAILKDIYEEHDVVVLAGGSGLYVQILCEGMDDIPRSEESLSLSLQEELTRNGTEGLFRKLKRLDPEYAKTVDRKNGRRILRALEVCITTGRPYSKLRQGRPVERPFNVFYACLELPRETLYERINTRIDRMFENGLVDEARSLYQFRHLRTLNTLGYKELFGFFEGSYDIDRAKELIKRNTRRYARMQMSWWRRKTNIEYFHPDDHTGILSAFRKQVAAS